uniref:Rad21/Rec8-like protein N-terminal domain-containing protein n=1 Tax=Periophthalmus magnuspinnatus TaxID=409849 RepID=A0A3B4B8P5_9GOBI
MFYYPNVLQRHSGCFSTIWLAATKGVKVTRRELLRVNVKKTCVDILNYITAQVPPPQQNLPKPRFSLYLSSQLQYGVVVVYHRQCGFLLDEIQQIIDRLLRSKKSVPIDIPASDRLALDLPDNLCMMEQAEGALDPFFGLMESHQLPSPYKVNQVIRTPVQSYSNHALLWPCLFTFLKVTHDLLQSLWKQAYLTQACPSILTHQSFLYITLSIIKAFVFLCPQLIARPVQKPGGPRKRQLVFADPEVQISNKEMKERIENPQLDSPLKSKLVHHCLITKRRIFVCCFPVSRSDLIHFDLKALWKTSAVLTSITEPEEEEEQEREIMMTEGKKRHSAMKEVGGSVIVLVFMLWPNLILCL